MLEEDIKSSDELLKLANELMKEEDYNGALNMLSNFLDLEAYQVAPVYFLCATACRQLGSPKTSPANMIYVAKCYLGLKKWNAAREYLESCIQSSDQCLDDELVRFSLLPIIQYKAIHEAAKLLEKTMS